MDGPDRSTVDRLAAAYARVGVELRGGELLGLRARAPQLRQRPPAVAGRAVCQVAILALLVGSALGVALVAAELRLEPQFKRLLRGVETDRRAKRAARPRPEPRAQSNGKPEREPEPARAERAAPLATGALPRRAGPRPAAERKQQRPPRAGQRQQPRSARGADASQGQGLRCTTRD